MVARTKKQRRDGDHDEPVLPCTMELRVPCPNAVVADTIRQVLAVDRDVRPTISRREFAVDVADAKVLIVRIRAATIKDLRTTASSVLDMASLVGETIDAFPPRETAK
ncbi:hypothetical protein DFJ73DRAFT_842865 [Zopfochytrium polystomum]|nr:hypothetical protein DFJ73DRAFT_842865 [Zopfochytrium polystomum]